MAKRLLFLALSGVRIRNPDLLNAGMQLPGFAQRGTTIAELPSLGLLTLAALTPSSWDLEYYEMDGFDASYIKSLGTSDFALIAISALTARILTAYRIADELRSCGKTIVLGGLHVTACPREAMLHADAVVVGEGEPLWKKLLNDFAAGNLMPVYRSVGTYNLSDSPVPRYDLLNERKYNRIPIQTTRGCPLDCEFCGSSRMLSRFKRRSLDSVRLHLEAVLAQFPQAFVELADDNTFVNKSWSRALAQLFSLYSMRWFTETDISVAEDDILLELLASAGCAQLLIGFESPRKACLSGLDSRNWKLHQMENYLKNIRKIQAHGISVNGCFAFGFDADTQQSFTDARDFIRASGLAEVQITLLTPFPGTGLYNKMQKEKRLLPAAGWDKYTLFDATFEPKQMTVAELESGLLWLAKELYSEEATRDRKRSFATMQHGHSNTACKADKDA